MWAQFSNRDPPTPNTPEKTQAPKMTIQRIAEEYAKLQFLCFLLWANARYLWKPRFSFRLCSAVPQNIMVSKNPTFISRCKALDSWSHFNVLFYGIGRSKDVEWCFLRESSFYIVTNYCDVLLLFYYFLLPLILLIFLFFFLFFYIYFFFSSLFCFFLLFLSSFFFFLFLLCFFSFFLIRILIIFLFSFF